VDGEAPRLGAEVAGTGFRDEPPARTEDRIHVLDVLRGIALLGMFLVHFHDFSSGGGGIDSLYQKIVVLFFEERFWTMFGMLFGVGFAIQFRRADARGESFVPKYLRRLTGLAGFGLIAEAIIGFNVLLSYAIWGFALPIVRRWSTPVLVGALLVSAASGDLYVIARATYGVATKGEQAYRDERRDAIAQERAFVQANNQAREATDYSTVLAARMRRIPWFYSQWYTFLPVNTFTLFLLGVLGLRLGLFDRPHDHRRLIVALMVFGVASWVFETWVPSRVATPGAPLVREMILTRLAGGFGVVRGMWLTFTYVGAVLLLVARNPAWLRRLAVFGWTGRMALTNYMIQIGVLDLMFSNYALGLSVRPLVGLVAALALFGVDAASSRWWLARYRYGPLEWLWRSITYARWQAWRVAPSVLEPV
jgi:uncharacterized protein